MKMQTAQKKINWGWQGKYDEKKKIKEEEEQLYFYRLCWGEISLKFKKINQRLDTDSLNKCSGWGQRGAFMRGFRPGVNRAWQEADYGLCRKKKMVLISAMQKMWMGWSLKKDKKGIRMCVKISFQADDCGRKSWRRNISRAKRIMQLFFLSCYCRKIKFKSVFSTQTHTYDHLQPSADSTTHLPTHTKKGRVLWTGGPDAAAATWTRTNNPMTPLITGTNNTSSNRGNDARKSKRKK